MNFFWNSKYISLAYALQMVINNGVLWVFGRFVFVKGLRATHHSLLTHGNLKIDIFKILETSKKSSQIWTRLGETLLDPFLEIL